MLGRHLGPILLDQMSGTKDASGYVCPRGLIRRGKLTPALQQRDGRVASGRREQSDLRTVEVVDRFAMKSSLRAPSYRGSETLKARQQ